MVAAKTNSLTSKLNPRQCFFKKAHVLARKDEGRSLVNATAVIDKKL